MKTALTLNDAPALTKSDIFDLDGAYHQMLLQVQRDDRQGHFHPSAVGMCGRRNVYEYIRTPRTHTIEPKSLEIFDLGHAIHDLVGRKLNEVGAMLKAKTYGYELELEKPYDPATDQLYVDFGIGGTTDGLLTVWTNEWRQRSVIEIKSMGKDQFEKLTAPKEDHVMQAHLYCFRWNAPIMYIWYYGKNNSERQVFPLVYDHNILLEALTRYQGWLQHVDAGTLPDREEDWFMCPRCEYAHTACHPTVLSQLRAKKAKLDDKRVANARKGGRLRRID
jgi:hypothetical protein